MPTLSLCLYHHPWLPPPLCGECDTESFIHSLTATCAEVVQWKKNLFPVPLGNSTKKFVQDLNRLIQAYAEQSTLESVAFQAVTVMLILLLQKPTRTSRPKDHVSCLERHLNAWANGDINPTLMTLHPPRSLTSYIRSTLPHDPLLLMPYPWITRSLHGFTQSSMTE